MTIHEFLKLLSRTPRDWRVERGRIRRGPATRPDCPLTAVAHRVQEGGPTCGVIWGPGLPLDPDTLNGLVAACDDLPGADPQLRAHLMRACGLDDPGPGA